MPAKVRPRPAGLPNTKHVFQHDKSKRDWHAEFEWRTGQEDTDSIVVIHVMTPEGERLEGSHSYAFNKEELADPTFDAEARLIELVGERIDRSERIIENRSKLASTMTKFKPKNA